MANRAVFDKIELHLVRVFHTVISERSVSRAAVQLGSTQPAVSAQLKRLRALVGDPLLVRSGAGMVPTEVALQLLGTAADLLRSAEQLFGGKVSARAFSPQGSEVEFRIAASDYLDPLFLPALVARLRREAPLARVTLHALSAEYDYRARLARGEVDLVIGNWLEPPGELHLGRLYADEIVCLVGEDHPAVRSPRSWTVERYLAAEHVAPTPMHAGALGFIDEHLARAGLQRHIAVRSPHFSLVPALLAQTHLVLTTGRLFCGRYLAQLPLRIVRCPMAFPSLSYYQLWHDVSHSAASLRWLREMVRDVARGLAQLRQPDRRILSP
ncbi:DNA-binding transcriptional LysR family regulator [Sphaerotilus hippei]|uniref:DNA-binding transcriptional LysR family regulator n=1 Tax=Sphaerotilus hippei TaxID=744406 RepID=A0A318H4U9_9BURK|nr:LysR family transcriptional regulator [Sphaerotilus hippei]PXW97076.1 DNA-binding transcriptional LysR family regulator [Sphaerotilus hippei]